MHLKILSQWLTDRLVIGHSTRTAALLRVVGALLSGGKLSLTHLGRSLNGSSKRNPRLGELEPVVPY